LALEGRHAVGNGSEHPSEERNRKVK